MGLVCQPSSQPDIFGHPECIINVDYNLDDDPLVSEQDIAEVEDFIQSYPDLTKDFIPIAVIGEGTTITHKILFYKSHLKVHLARCSKRSM